MMVRRLLVFILFIVLLSFFYVSPIQGEVDYFHRGIQSYQEENFEEAVFYLKEALTIQEDSYLHYLLGLTYLQLEEGELARASMEESLVLDPSFYLAYINMARAEILLENYEEGLLFLDKAISLEDNDFAVYHLKGRIYLNLNRWERAKENFLRARELDPGNIYVLNNLGLSYIYLGLFSLAREVLEEAARKDAPLPYLYNNLGIVYENLDLFDKALASYRIALEIDPHHFHARLNYGRLQERIERE